MFKKTIKALLGIALIPLAMGTGKAFYDAMASLSIFSSTLQVMERGVFAYLVFHVMIMRPAYIYVLGHELVHVVATWICGGNVVSFSVSPSGGNVVTSKSNFFIELSPYFVPIYTLLLGPFYLIAKALPREVPHLSIIFLFLVGVTLAFHFVMTSEVLRMQQPDIMKSGLIFSLVLIFIGNLIITTAVFCPFFSSISFVGFLKASVYNSRDMYVLGYGKVLGLVNYVQNLLI